MIIMDRKITDLTSVNTAKHRYELSNENYENTIKIKEQEKKNIEKQKTSFEGSSEYKRRNKREEKPQYRSRNVNNNNNTN